MDKTIITSILSMAGLGFFFSSVLALVNQKLKVQEDPMVEKIVNVLPGLNCGACGFASCRQYAEALAKKEIEPDQCKAGGEAVLGQLCEILGVTVGERIKEKAFVHCGADEDKRKKKANYTGVKTCVAAHEMFGGEILCEYGCLGYGDCMKACPFEAIRIVRGLAEIDGNKCTACGKCRTACPRDIITVEKIESKDFLYVVCNNPEKGPETRKTCPVGCIACGICQKLTNGVFHVENNIAQVQYDNLKNVQNTDEVVSKCPTKCIKKT